jgi:UDP-N-acetylglucosamine acyltransferase
MEIHPQAVVNPKARLAQGVKIGPYSIIGEHVSIGQDTVVGAHTVIEGHTRLGERNTISHFTTIGASPQDISYKGEDTRLMIGNDNVIREYVTIHRASAKGQKTVIGNSNYIMSYAHIAHDCVLGDHVVFANLASVSGHVTIGDHAILGGMAGVHQFVRIGVYAFIGGQSGIDRDVPPYMITSKPRAKLFGINRKGLARAGFSQETIEGLKKAYRIIWRENRNFSRAIEQVKRELKPFAELEILLDFLKGSARGILR